MHYVKSIYIEKRGRLKFPSPPRLTMSQKAACRAGRRPASLARNKQADNEHTGQPPVSARDMSSREAQPGRRTGSSDPGMTGIKLQTSAPESSLALVWPLAGTGV